MQLNVDDQLVYRTNWFASLNGTDSTFEHVQVFSTHVPTFNCLIINHPILLTNPCASRICFNAPTDVSGSNRIPE